MNRILFYSLSAFLLLLSFSLSARERGVVVYLEADDASVIQVAVDGKRFHKEAKKLRLTNLPPGKRKLKVYHPLGQNRRGVIFDGTIRLKAGEVYYITIHRKDHTASVRAVAEIHQRSNAPHNTAERVSVKQPSAQTPDSRHTSGKQSAALPTLTAQNLEKMTEKIRQLSADSHKLEFLKQELDQQYYTTAQLRELASLLQHDSSRLSFLTWAYDTVTDSESFASLEDLFLFDSSRDDLRQFLEEAGR